MGSRRSGNAGGTQGDCSALKFDTASTEVVFPDIKVTLMKTLLSLSIIVLFGTALTGCGIIGGAGKDISSVGHVVTKSANAVKNTISN